MSLLDKFLEKKLIKLGDFLVIESKIKGGGSLDDILIEYDISPEDIFETKKEYYNIEVIVIDRAKPTPEEILNIIPFESAKMHQIIPLEIKENLLVVGMINPENLAAKSVLQFISNKLGKSYQIKLISQKDFNFSLSNYTGLAGSVSQALGEYSTIQSEEFKKLQKEASGEKSGKNLIQETAPIAKIVSNIVKYAAENQASDIHIEIDAKEISVRYRVDGILKKDLILPKNIHPAIVARIKILSRIKIDEKRRPQDGRFSGKFIGRKIDFRVSTFPTYFGEKVVMRLLEQERGALPIEKLGFTDENLSLVKKIIQEPYGIILICGPTGSGKTNTLYSLLNELDKERKNVVSLENPIELNIPGVSQSQVRPELDYTFAKGLRSILRQDPDIIMVGEIRDTETAKLAIQAALTGHLVLSTIHTNTAADVPQRLVDMGVEPYLIGPTIIAAIGQRLIRTIEKGHARAEKIPETIKNFIVKNIEDLPVERKRLFFKNEIWTAQPSEHNQTGMKGRVAVFEILSMIPEIQRKILNNPSSSAVYEIARNNNFLNLKEDAILKALSGVTTFDEVMKL